MQCSLPERGEFVTEKASVWLHATATRCQNLWPHKHIDSVYSEGDRSSVLELNLVVPLNSKNVCCCAIALHCKEHLKYLITFPATAYHTDDILHFGNLAKIS